MPRRTMTVVGRVHHITSTVAYVTPENGTPGFYLQVPEAYYTEMRTLLQQSGLVPSLWQHAAWTLAVRELEAADYTFELVEFILGYVPKKVRKPKKPKPAPELPTAKGFSVDTLMVLEDLKDDVEVLVNAGKMNRYTKKMLQSTIERLTGVLAAEHAVKQKVKPKRTRVRNPQHDIVPSNSGDLYNSTSPAMEQAPGNIVEVPSRWGSRPAGNAVPASEPAPYVPEIVYATLEVSEPESITYTHNIGSGRVLEYVSNRLRRNSHEQRA